VEFIYSARGTGYSNMATLELTVPLQIRRAYRQDPKLAAKLAEASQAKAEREDMLREHAADIAAAIDTWENTRERRNRYRTTIIPLAADRTVAARAAYQGGKATLNDLLAAHRAEIDARLKALELEATAARLWAQLAFLTVPPDGMPPATRLTSAGDGELP
jgi:outer membrane protein TolC